jgi:SAM-dependent methyltransferase
MTPSTQGYAEQAAELIPRYEAVPFEHKYRAENHLLPQRPSRILDVGAGTGADAAWLAAQSHTVLAVEPTAALREAGQALHPQPTIEWLDDSLPDLACVLQVAAESSQAANGAAGVHWTRLALRWAAEAHPVPLET